MSTRVPGGPNTSSEGPSINSEGHSSSSLSRRRKRGHTRAFHVYNRPSTDKKDMRINDFDVIVGDYGAEFATFCGTLARTPTLLPLDYHDWRLIPKHYKEDTWDRIKEKYNVSDSAQHVVLMRIGHSWRDYKGELKKMTEEKYPNLLIAPRPMNPVEIPQTQWEYLLGRWTSSQWQDKSKKNKESRSKQTMSHTMAEELCTCGEDMRLKTRMARTFRNKIDEKLEEQPPEMREMKPVQDKAFVAVVGPDSSGRVFGQGFGVKPTTFGTTPRNIEARRQQEESQREVRELREELRTMREELTEMGTLKEKLVEMDTLKERLTEMDAMKRQIEIITQGLLGRGSSQCSVNLSDN
ncbi:uncharacterized protein LOC122647391 [Telopea speciosissima]|uniref:uncharacterized protein LOC122647391 n=1 Tax=Telopea speciosissima TaxID=54955 RepID=UPI001CC75F03|nr:uncharacterized protein LOC122647391 [Telopea speciosissima]